MTVGQEHLLCKGTVKNTSGKQLDYVQIVATYYDNKMKLVTSGETLIESQSLSKDQSSPFKVYTPYDEKL